MGRSTCSSAASASTTAMMTWLPRNAADAVSVRQSDGLDRHRRVLRDGNDLGMNSTGAFGRPGDDIPRTWNSSCPSTTTGAVTVAAAAFSWVACAHTRTLEVTARTTIRDARTFFKRFTG